MRQFSFQLNLNVDENNNTIKYIDFTNLQFNNPEDKEDYNKKCIELNKLGISLLNNNIESNIKINNEKFNIKIKEKEQEHENKMEKTIKKYDEVLKNKETEINNLENECMRLNNNNNIIKKDFTKKKIEMGKENEEEIKKIKKKHNENFNEKLNNQLKDKENILFSENKNKTMEIKHNFEKEIIEMKNAINNLEYINEISQEKNETYQETIEKLQEENQNLQEDLQKKNKRKSNKEIGDIGELNVCKILDIYYEKDRTIRYNQTRAYGCADIKITIDRYNGCIDTKDKSNEFKIKNTKKTIGKSSIDKLKRDVNNPINNYQFGILISNGQEKFYDNKKDFEYILNNKKPIYFLKGINEEPEKLKSLIEIIRYTLPIILSAKNDNELNEIKVKVNKVSEKIKENIKLCNINIKNNQRMKKNNNDNLVLFNFSKEKIEEILDKKPKLIQNKKECPYCKNKFSERGGAYKQHIKKYCKLKPKD